MAKILKKVDVVTVGVGWTGGIVAAECSKAGLKVVGLERGGSRTTEDFSQIHDEYRYAINYGLMQDLSKETVTFRNTLNQKALPMRKMGSFLLGNGEGGAGVHWNGWTYRFFPYDFEIKTMTEKRYGKNKVSKDYLIQDWGITYDEMEPYFDKFEKTAGISGEAKNPFEGKRSSDYPNPPLNNTPILLHFEEVTKKMNYHPYRMPAANSSQSYTNPDGETLNPCQYCAFCERFGCEYGAKASPIVTVIPTALKTGNYEIRHHSNVVEILKKGDKVTGVKYINTLTLEEYIQPADIVVLSSYMLNNAKLLMISKIGEQYDPMTRKGTLGKNYCYQLNPATTAFFDKQFNVFMGAGALGTNIDDFNGDNFDHSDLDFIHGALIYGLQSGARPISNNPVQKGIPSWGSAFKRASIYNYTRVITVGGQGSSMPYFQNYLSLDPTYKDAYGYPLLRMTYNFTDQDRALFKFITKKTEAIAKAMNPKSILSVPQITNYSVIPYQSTHNVGGTTMGIDPSISVVNTYLQHWDADNLFVVGAGNFAHNSGYNPTGTAGALAYRCAEGIIKYHKTGSKLG
ncbi:GMC family oxidoreductase [Helicobacter sp. 13S00477-4]|uniref:GMC family oxidoreductase n=1 Tax=Helicobacter sp. 13S00477-4 TaxID=1905759 RepID=UPI000BA52683|nr:GMC family oxidoreductase [Helicobacter sp. 13S00477-4]PAF52676.1 GMC family oxidoreductase [Helicobacter sp. 13S00477-4]